MKSSNESKRDKRVIFLCVVCSVFVFSTIWFAFGEGRLRKRERLINERAVSSLCESLDSISTGLKKSVYTADGDALGKIGNELCRQAAAAKESLNLIDVNGELGDEIYKFLSQVGDYTVALSRNSGQSQSEKTQQLRKLSNYADGISAGLNEICLDYYNGDVSFGEAVGNLEVKAEEIPADFYVRLEDTAQTISEYPTLIYDGPFSDSVSKKESVFLKGKSELTEKEAMKKVADAFSLQLSALKKEEDILSQPQRYCFSVNGNDITVTKTGGYICTLLTDTYVFEENIGEKEAIRRGRKYLEKLGYKDMTDSYYSTYDGICTINFAYEKDGVIFYPDIIKVSVALDTGRITGLDARSYLMNHRDRALPEEKITGQKAVSLILPSLEAIDTRAAVIPLDTGKEVFCYELHCRDTEDKELLIYINALTGKQEDLLILLYSDGGILTK